MEIVIASCIDQGLEMSYEPLLKSGKPPRHVWLLPTLLIGPVLILCAHRIHKQQDFRGSCGRSLPLHSCHRVDRSLQIALIPVREEPDGPSSPSRAKVGPLFCRVGAVVSCPRSPCAWTKPKKGAAGRRTSGVATSSDCAQHSSLRWTESTPCYRRTH